MHSESERIDYLDSIRGLAAFAVLMFHTLNAFAWPGIYFQIAGQPFIAILFDGQEAVCMFFVLSGYVLSKPYVYSGANHRPRTLFVPAFYLRRMTRVWLPWFCVFLVSFLVRQYVFRQPATTPPITPWLDQYWHAPATAGDFFRQCFFLLHDGARQLVPQDWSLCVEMRASLVIPFLVYLARPGKTVLLGLLALLFAGLAYHYVSFVVGVLLARYGEMFAGWFDRRSRLVRVLFLISGLVAYQGLSLLLKFFPKSNPVMSLGWTLTSIGCAMLLVSCFSSRLLRQWLRQKALVYLGRISYSVYLLQLMVILCVLPPLVQVANRCGITSSPALLALTFLSSIGVTIAGAAVSFRFIETPAINLGHRWTKAWQRRFQSKTDC